LCSNYDINVLMAAISSRGYGIKWFDRRKGASAFLMLNATINFDVCWRACQALTTCAWI
jgi:hypothetical protein